jgi:hypothetical protein
LDNAIYIDSHCSISLSAKGLCLAYLNKEKDEKDKKDENDLFEKSI